MSDIQSNRNEESDPLDTSVEVPLVEENPINSAPVSPSDIKEWTKRNQKK